MVLFVWGVQAVGLDGTVVDQDFQRISLPCDVAPGSMVDQQFVVEVPGDGQISALRFDLVSEHVCWFVHLGSQPLSIPVVSD